MSSAKDIILRGYEDIGNNWRSKWLRLGTRSSLTHCTLTIGDLTLHVDYKGSNWYPTHRLLHSYEGSYVCVSKLYLGSTQRPIYIRPDAGSTWSVIKWKYLFGKRPSGCSVACIDALRQNDINAPELILPHKLIEHYTNDYTRSKRQSTRR